MTEKIPTIEIDADPSNADWTKNTWDLPPYGSKEFYETMGPGFDEEAFKQSPAYLGAVESGLIMDEEWVDDHVGEPEKEAPTKTRSRVKIHYH